MAQSKIFFTKPYYLSLTNYKIVKRSKSEPKNFSCLCTLTCLFYQSFISLTLLYLPRGEGLGSLLQFFNPFFYPGHYSIYPAALSHKFRRGNYLPCKLYCFVLACIKGTQDWEFFWLRFWNLPNFFVSYVKILRFYKKKFFDWAIIWGRYDFSA
jgi:hypothetical protein